MFLFVNHAFTLLLNILVYVILPDFPSSVISVIPNSNPLRFILLPVQAYITVPAYMSVYVLLLVPTTYAVVIFPFVCNELKLGGTTYNSSINLRTVNHLIREYNSVKILQSIVNSVFGIFIIPFQTFTALVFFKAATTILLHSNALDMVSLAMMTTWAVLAPLVFGVFLQIGAYMFLHVNKVLESWTCYESLLGSRRDRMIMNRFRKACTPICIRYENVYTVQPQSVLAFIYQLVDGLTDILLAVKLT